MREVEQMSCQDQSSAHVRKLKTLVLSAVIVLFKKITIKTFCVLFVTFPGCPVREPIIQCCAIMHSTILTSLAIVSTGVQFSYSVRISQSHIIGRSATYATKFGVSTSERVTILIRPEAITDR